MDSLPETLGRQAREQPGSLAIVDGIHRLTYAQLYKMAGIVAAHLCECGISPGDRVAMLLPNCPQAVALIYGTWLAGGVIVPLNPQARGQEACALAQHAGARIIVCEPGYRDLDTVVGTAETSNTLVPMIDDLISAGDTAIPAPAKLKADDLAMLLYTSGTTGHPKAVMLSHGNISANVAAIIDYLELTREDRVLSVLPFNYSYGSSVLHTHLAVGATIVLEKNLVFPHALAETMVRERVTGFPGVPSTFALLLSRVDLASMRLDSLRYVTQAGAAMPATLVEKLRKALPQAQIFIMYGQTEATARLSYVPPDRLADKPGSAGIPVSGVEIEIRDEQRRTLKSYDTGEVWVRGPNVMQGYWHDESATQAALVDGWLKTGDIGYRDDEGFLFLVGRRSDIIKTGAHRVHPGEIEEVIAGLAGVSEVAIAGIDDELLGQTIAAWVVPEPGHDISVEAIKARCRDMLASYKIPKQVQIVATLPRTASGKLRRIELSSPKPATSTKEVH
ncbi:MAG: acyl--CoA ligase [Chromatiales bacterium]|nr:acyl--CoA ligase [Chromatiales bacterium]